METNSTGAIVFDIQRPEVSNETKIKIWRSIIAFLPFNDQLNYRLVSKTWMNLIASLPGFRNKLCLNLGYSVLSENDPPVSILRNSGLEFNTLKIGEKLSLQLFPNWVTFLARLGETVTYLDIRGSLEYKFDGQAIHGDAFRLIVENLYLFKVLHHLNVGSATEWFKVATSTSPRSHTLKNILNRMIDSHSPDNSMSSESVQRFLESPAMDYFQQGIFLSRYKTVFLRLIERNLHHLGQDSGTKKRSKVIDFIIQKLEEKIKKADEKVDFSTRVNKSCRILTFRQENGLNVELIENLLTRFVPNVQEINMKLGWFLDLDDNQLQLVERFADKMGQFRIQSLRDDPDGDLLVATSSNLCNLKHLKIGNPFLPFPEETTNECLSSFPKIKSIHACANSLPQSHFNYITKIEIEQDVEGDEDEPPTVQLIEVAAFKNLHTLDIMLKLERDELCFFAHHPEIMASIKKLRLNVLEYHVCTKCFRTMLRSMPNVREFDFCSEIEDKYLDSIFNYLPNAEKIKIECDDSATKFEPKKGWSEMRKLRVLILINFIAFGGKAAWDDFGTKLKNLKYLKVSEKIERNQWDFEYEIPEDRTDLVEVIGSNWSALQKLGFFVLRDVPENDPEDDEMKDIDLSLRRTKTVMKNGKKLVIDEYDF